MTVDTVRSDGARRRPATETSALAKPLRALDVAYGLVVGEDAAAEAIVPRRPPLKPVEALEAALARALVRPPCLVSFSGGRDSSALLAVATRVARRDGYAVPIPATLRFPGSVAADEDEWQSVVVRHLRLEDWVRIVVEGDQLDAVGPVATTALRRHGLLWPFNTHFHVPIVKCASGGSIVTGFGGDELASSSATARAEQVLTRSVPIRPSDLLAVGLACSPRVLRTAVRRGRAQSMLRELPWLTASGRRSVARSIGSDDGSIPLGWSRVLRTWIPRRRYFRVCQESFSVIGRDHGVEVLHPFVEPDVLDALAARGGFAGLGDRTAMTRLLFGDVLPEATVRRPTKGSFTDPLWTATAREFAASWSGGGVDTNLVDIEALRRHWTNADIDVRSTTLLQAAWLHDATSPGAGAA